MDSFGIIALTACNPALLASFVGRYNVELLKKSLEVFNDSYLYRDAVMSYVDHESFWTFHVQTRTRINR
jgi:hypothetical protein